MIGKKRMNLLNAHKKSLHSIPDASGERYVGAIREHKISSAVAKYMLVLSCNWDQNKTPNNS